jgi:transposase
VGGTGATFPSGSARGRPCTSAIGCGRRTAPGNICSSRSRPEKSDSQAARRRKGSRGGRPPGFDAERYKKRNTVERAINKLKQFLAVATRHDKRRCIYLGTTTAAALVIWLRS